MRRSFMLALGRLRHRPLAGLLSLTLLCSVLLLAALAGSLLMNLLRFAAELEQEVGLVVYLVEDAPAGRLQELVRKLQRFPGVLRVRPVPRQLALAELKATLGEDGDLLDELGPELLPDSVEVLPGPAAVLEGGLEALHLQLLGLPHVASVARAGKGRDSVLRLAALLDILRAGAWVLLITMLGLTTWMVAGVVSLGVMDRAEELTTMRLLGASEPFLRGPCLAEGFLLSSAASLLAIVGLLGLMGTLRAALGPDASLVGIRIELPDPWALGAFVLLSGLVGLLGAELGAARGSLR